MIRRLVKVVVAGTCILSLILCAGTGWLWWRGRHGKVDEIGHAHHHGSRYTLFAHNGRIELFAPASAPGGAAAERKAGVLAAGMSNADLVWRCEDLSGTMKAEVPVFRRPELEGLWAPNGRMDANATRPLLAALEDPDRFAAAHVALCGRGGIGWWAFTWDPTVVAGEGSYYKMRVRLVRRREAADANGWEFTCDAVIDPAQRPALLRLWHARFDVPVQTLSLVWPLLAFPLPPSLWLGTAGRRAIVRRRRGRTGGCVSCGYDLTGNVSGTCPECGAQRSRSS